MKRGAQNDPERPARVPQPRYFFAGCAAGCAAAAASVFFSSFGIGMSPQPPSAPALNIHLPSFSTTIDPDVHVSGLFLPTVMVFDSSTKAIESVMNVGFTLRVIFASAGMP